MATKDQIDSFHEFASQQIQNGGASLSMDELFLLWQAQNPSNKELADSTAAVRAALQDMENGDTGRPIEEFISNMRSKHNIPSGE